MKDVAARLVGRTLPEGTESDAIHIPVYPVELAEDLPPGAWVVIEDGKARKPKKTDRGWLEAGQAIIDPFMDERYWDRKSKTPMIKKGSRVFVMFPPGTISSLRHVWTHPALDFEDAWLTGFASQFEMSAEALIIAARKYLDHGEYCGLPFDTPDDGHDGYYMGMFWEAYRKKTGDARAEDRKDGFFSCAC
jgi:hypothetical protein